MKTALLAFCLSLLLNISAQAQVIAFRKNNVPDFPNQERVHSKPVLIFIEGPPLTGDAVRTQNHFLKNIEVGKVYNQAFISYKVAFGSKEFEKLVRIFKPGGLPLFVFLNQEGEEILRHMGYLNNAEGYIQLSDSIHKKLSTSNYLGAYDKRYLAGERSRGFLKTYIEARMQSGISDNADLIEDYLQFLTLGEINNYDEMLFLLKAGPLIGSKTMSLSFMHKRVRDSIYKTIPFHEAKMINNYTIENSFKKAVERKDRAYANQIGNFISGTYTDFQSGSRARNLRMLDFYKAIKDTASFLRDAGYFIDREYMRISIDSAKKTLHSKPPFGQVAPSSPPALDPRLVAFQAHQNTTSGILNNAAWDFYLIGTKNEGHLKKALSWVKRSLEIEPAPYNYDTYAHLLYRLGSRGEAVVHQTKAVNLAKERNLDPAFLAKLRNALNKMKAGTL